MKLSNEQNRGVAFKWSKTINFKKIIVNVEDKTVKISKTRIEYSSSSRWMMTTTDTMI